MSEEKKLIYCSECENWSRAAGCMYVISVEPNHPISPEKVYAQPEVQNKDNDCQYFKPRGESGLGLVGDLIPENGTMENSFQELIILKSLTEDELRAKVRKERIEYREPRDENLE